MTYTRHLALALTVVNFILLVIIVTGGPVTAAQNAIRAEKFELVDANGVKRAVLGAIPGDMATFTLYDSKGNFRVAISARDSGSTLLLEGPTERYRIQLNTDSGNRTAKSSIAIEDPDRAVYITPKDTIRGPR